MQTREKTKQIKIKENNKEEERTMRNKKGISLIVLVITIIVMIILAAAVIISLSNSGVINRANEAVNATNLAEVQHLASLAWSEAYLENMNLPEEERNEKIKEAVEKVFTDNNLNAADYNLTYGAGGVTVTAKGETVAAKWKIERTTDANGKVTKVVVTNGTDTYDVGTVVNYMPQGVGPENAKYTKGWKILGADKEGRLLIMSSASITGNKVKIGSSSSFEEAKTSVENALTTLQNTVKDYKDGTIGVSVRSITVEDVNAVTGYDPTTYTGYFMGVSGLKRYNIEVSYTWNSTGVGYSFKNGSETKSGSIVDGLDNGFTYYDENTNTFKTSAKATSGDIATLKHTNYGYMANIDNTTEAYKMLFVDDGSSAYWLASRFVNLHDYGVDFGVRYVCDGGGFGMVDIDCLMYSNGSYDEGEYEARAVVTLAPGVSLTESTTVAGTYDLSI